MRKLLLLALCIWANSAAMAQAVAEKPETQKAAKPEELVRDWFRRLNELDGSRESVDRFVALYHPDALLQVGPSERQIGPVYNEGQALIRKWAEDFSRDHVPIPETDFFALARRTVNEKTAELFHATETPWSGMAVSVEFTGRYLVPDSKRGFMVSGAAFFEFREGKISKLRLYMPREEIREIDPPFRP